MAGLALLTALALIGLAWLSGRMGPRETMVIGLVLACGGGALIAVFGSRSTWTGGVTLAVFGGAALLIAGIVMAIMGGVAGSQGKGLTMPKGLLDRPSVTDRRSRDGMIDE